MPRTQYRISYLRALQMVVRNIMTLPRAELGDLIEENTVLLGDDENGDYIIIREKK